MRGGAGLEPISFHARPTIAGPAVRQRSVDTAEVRPELNHATNAAVVIGRRELTRGCFLDRRAFLPSYDPRGDDSTGSLLEVVLAPALMVCSVRTGAAVLFPTST